MIVGDVQVSQSAGVELLPSALSALAISLYWPSGTVFQARPAFEPWPFEWSRPPLHGYAKNPVAVWFRDR